MLNKQPININFSQGLDTKTDPWQVAPGKFLSLQNTIFTKAGLLQKRNGFAQLTTLANSSNYLTTFKGNLTAIGTAVNAYAAANSIWVSKGYIQPLQLSTLPLIKNSLNQTQCDAVVASNGLLCVVYSELNNSTTTYKYAILDSVTGQNIVAPVAIPVTSGTVTGAPRVFLLGTYFIICFTNVISATSHLQYIAISSTNPTVATTNQDLAASYISAATLSWDAVLANGALYVGYNTTTGGQAVVIALLTQQNAAAGSLPGSTVTFAGSTATAMSMCADNTIPSHPIIYAAFYNSGNANSYVVAIDSQLNKVLNQTTVLSTISAASNITCTAINKVCTVFVDVTNTYAYNSLPSNFIDAITCTQAGVVGTPYTVIRSVGLASKAFMIGTTNYFLAAYTSTYQPTYYLINASISTAAAPAIVAELAYSNGGGYLATGLPNVTVNGTIAQISYLYKDLIAPVNKVTNVSGVQTAGIYTQTGVNMATFNFSSPNGYISTVETGNNLNIGAGFLSMYDGYLPVENNFFVWPDNISAATSATGGSMTAQQYYYQVTYEWSDNQGNIFRSAPSIPVTVTLTSQTSTTIQGPYLRLTNKSANPVKIVIYRWSAGQQSYYQVTSLTAPILNDTTTDAWTYNDKAADSTIIGNSLLYTTGGVVENVSGPSSNNMTLFDNRLWLVDAEDQNLLWYSKQVIEATPVEMSDLFTVYISPTIGVGGSTGPITALATMDDKLVIFKKDAIYYINGVGPDNSGSNSQYSQPIFVTSTVGCANQASIALIPQGLMFQSDKGIWLLGRDLSTSYIGAPVEKFNSSIVQSAVVVPGTNQIRLSLSTGQILMYDYFYAQWGTFIGVPNIASCIYNGYHTFLNSYSGIYQETPGLYADGSNPVLISFTTSWLNLAGIQGYERIYDFYLLGSYISPHYLNVGIAYDYGPISNTVVIQPQNYTGVWGADSTWGVITPWGGPNNLEHWRVHTAKQLCQSFQITVSEQFNPFFGATPGAGLTLSGLTCRVGIKKGVRPIKAASSIG